MRLDVGCGTSPKGDVNIDVHPQKVENFILADACHLPLKVNAFDVAFASHVLEHLQNPIQALRELKRVCKKLIVYTPSEYNLDKTEDHFYTWNLHTLKNMLSEIFENVQVTYTSRNKILKGKISKYMPFLNMMLEKMGFHTELCALGWSNYQVIHDHDLLQ